MLKNQQRIPKQDDVTRKAAITGQHTLPEVPSKPSHTYQ